MASIDDSPADSTDGRIVILGTGGTIAGTAASRADNLGYRAAQLGVQALLDAVPALAAGPIECEQVAQIDSKDMGHEVWVALAQRLSLHLARPDVAGVVVTHGTDTLEETAYFLHRVLAPAKPVVLTAAMRPASSLQADGPQNLLDAVTVARAPGARGVVVAIAGSVFVGAEVRKTDSYRLDAFSAGVAGPLAVVEGGHLRRLRSWPEGTALGAGWLPADASQWPRVEIVTSHAGADGALVDALIALGVQGIVVAGTGNGSVHHALQAALLRAQAAGVAVLRVSRCAFGGVVGDSGSPLLALPVLSAPQARVELMLRLLHPLG